MALAHSLDSRLLKWSRLEVVFLGIMIGVGETYIAAYAIACGFSDRYSGLITALPLGLASILQLFAGRLTKFFSTRKRFVITAACAQAFTLFLIAGHNIFDRGSPALLIGVLTLYWVCGLSIAPAWNAWIVSLIEKQDRPHFFAQRGPFHEISVLTALVGAGVTLQLAADPMLIFALLFVLAGLSRLGSVFSLGQIPTENPRVTRDPAEAMDYPGFRRWIGQKKVRWFLLLLGSFHLTTNVASPFFTPFMLRQLNLDYSIYMLLIALPFVTRAFSYQVYESLVPKVGVVPVLIVVMALIAIVPSLWAWYPYLPALFLYQIISGFSWTGFEYSILLKQMSDFPPIERARVLTWTNLVVGFSHIFGAIIGSQFLGRHPTFESYGNLFHLSSGLRLCGIAVIFAIDWRISTQFVAKVYWRTLGVRSNRGVTRPILFPDEK